MANDVQQQYFGVTDKVPEETWYWASLGTIVGSTALFIADKHDWSVFAGQWALAFLLWYCQLGKRTEHGASMAF